MAEEIKVEQPAEDLPVIPEVKPADQPEKESVTPDVDFSDFEKSIERYSGRKTEQKAESQDPPPAEKQEQVTEEKKPEAVTNEDAKPAYEPVKFKWNGEDKDLFEAVKANPELIEEIQKRYDYTQKTQALKTERESFEGEREKVLEQVQLVQLDNLALIAGGTRKKPFLDPTGEANDDTMKKYDVYTDINQYMSANEKYDEWQGAVNKVEMNRRYSEAENQKIIEDFKGKYQDVDVNGLIAKFTPYVNYAVAKGQTPLPKDTFELMHRAFYFDDLVAEKTKAKDETISKLEAEKKAEFQKGYDEALKDTQGKTKPKQPTQVKVPQKENDGVFAEYENSINRFTRSIR